MTDLTPTGTELEADQAQTARENAAHADAEGARLKDEYDYAMAGRRDQWVAACGGTERPMLVNATRVLYVHNPATGHSAYMNLDSDIIMTDREVELMFGSQRRMDNREGA